MGHGGEAFECLEIEHCRTLHHAVDEQLVAPRVDGGYPGMVTLEVEIGGRHDPVQVLQRCEGAALGAPDGDAPRSLERRAPAELAEGRP